MLKQNSTGRGLAERPGDQQTTEDRGKATVTGPASAMFRRSTWLWLCAATTVGVWVALYLAQVLGSQFFADDFLYLQLARTGHLSPSWLAVNSYGHFAPITRLGYLLVERHADLNYGIAALVPSTLGAAIFLALVSIGSRLLGRGPAAFLLALAGATCLPLLRVAQWWGSAVHVLGAAFFMTACIAGFVALVRTGRRSYGTLSVTFLALGLLVQERPLLTIGYLVLIRYLFLTPTKTDSMRLTIRREALLWLPYVVVIAAYLTYRLFIFNAPPEPGNLHQGLLLTASGVERSFLPSLVGIRLGGGSGWLEPADVLGWLVLILLGVALLLLRRSAWKCAFFFAATYLANAALLAAGRLGVADAITQSRDLQYFVDPYLALVITLMLGFGTLPRRAETSELTRRVIRSVGSVVVGAITVATALSWHAFVVDNNQTPAHHFLNTALKDLKSQPGSFDLLRLTMPRPVAPDFLDPWTDESRILSLSSEVDRKMDPTSQHKVALLESGVPTAVHPVPLVSVSSSAQTMLPGNPSTTVSITTQGACVTGPRGATLRIALPHPVHARGLFFQVSYASRHPAPVTPAFQRKARTAFNFGPTALPAGQHTIVDRLDSADAHTLFLIFDSPVRHFCIRRVQLNQIAATDSAGCRVLDHQGRFTDERADCSSVWSG